MMTVLKNAAIAVLVYVAIVATFESLLGFLQPAGGSTLVITTFDKDGTPHDRVVSRLEFRGLLLGGQAEPAVRFRDGPCTGHESFRAAWLWRVYQRGFHPSRRGSARY